MNKNSAVDAYRRVERLYVPSWLTQRIHVTNFDLVDQMKWLLKTDSRFNEILCVERKEIDQLRYNDTSLRNLLRSPVLMVAPTLRTIEDWRCLINGTATTVAVDQLRAKLPPLDPVAKRQVDTANRLFLDLVTSVIHLTVLAAPLLGISHELAEYLVSVPPYRLRLTLGRLQGLPLFRWRFNTPTFWFQFGGSALTDEMVAHQIMETSPIRIADLPQTSGWSNLRLPREKNETYLQC